MTGTISSAQPRIKKSSASAHAFLHVALAALVLISGMNSLHAEPPVPAPTPEFKSTSSGIVVGAGVSMGTYGVAIPGDVMYENKGIQSIMGRQYLLQWDAAGGATGGYAANEHPGFYFAGGQLNLNAEAGYRAIPTSNWSPYLSVGGQVSGTDIGVIGLAPSNYFAANSTAGLSGINGVAATRFNLGASYLDPKHSLLLTAFVQEALRSPGSFASGSLYSEVGLHAQLDITQSLNVMLEALWGRTGQQTDSTFSAVNQGTHMEAVLSFRKMFGKWWVGLDGKLAEDLNKTAYTNSTNAYSTALPINPSAGLSLGIPIQ